MLKNRKILIVVCLLVFGGLIYGVSELFRLRFEQGDVYPPYSSLRADPLGVKAFYESLDQLHGVSVRRLYEPLYKLKESRDTTLFVLGVGAGEMGWTSEKEADDLENFLRGGGRLVISFFPENTRTWSTRHKEKVAKEKLDKKKKENKEKKEEAKKSDPKGKETEPKMTEPKVEELKKAETKTEGLKKKTLKKKTDDEDDFFADMISLKERWNLGIDYNDLDVDKEGISQPVDVERADGPATLPETISWHSAMYFNQLSTNWTSIYTRGTNAVVMERSFGKGSLVLVSDSYFLSNEGLRKDRQTALLAWLAGPSTHLMFDEVHFGVIQDPGIATLARQYHLHGLVFGLVLLAGFFVWKNAVSFIPPHEDVSESNHLLTGKESAAGFVNLLRRNIPATNVLSVCFGEWKKSCAQNRGHLKNKVERMEKVVAEEGTLPARQQNPPLKYQEVAKILAERR